MIKLFRHIRYNLMETGKSTKYFKYAIGEIILVVIGILIALQINNWNEQRKNHNTEKELLFALQMDFVETKKRLKETIKLQNTVISNSKKLIELYATNTLLEHKDSIPEYICYGPLSWWRAEPVTGTYDAMLSTGQIDLLRNKTLRRYLTEFDAEIKSGFEDHEHSMDLLTLLTVAQSESFFDLHSIKAQNEMGIKLPDDSFLIHKNIEEKIKKLALNKKFFGLLTHKLVMDQNRLRRQNKLLDFTDQILNQISLESK
ncbi:DUF6090 family protein [Winogradskyella aurantia]|uniref:DUF6090 family protein n=1 Tax=Winogradskyella aurantia TaxID=1915063 RepID=UPI0019801621|nr:DUF6090 family protein [Winogradskyella aurantia]